LIIDLTRKCHLNSDERIASRLGKKVSHWHSTLISRQLELLTLTRQVFSKDVWRMDKKLSRWHFTLIFPAIGASDVNKTSIFQRISKAI
jgi:hypothetical protein